MWAFNRKDSVIGTSFTVRIRTAWTFIYFHILLVTTTVHTHLEGEIHKYLSQPFYLEVYPGGFDFIPYRLKGLMVNFSYQSLHYFEYT